MKNIYHTWNFDTWECDGYIDFSWSQPSNEFIDKHKWKRTRCDKNFLLFFCLIFTFSKKKKKNWNNCWPQYIHIHTVHVRHSIGKLALSTYCMVLSVSCYRSFKCTMSVWFFFLRTTQYHTIETSTSTYNNL